MMTDAPTALERLRSASVGHLRALQAAELTTTPEPWLLPTYAALRDAVWEVWPRIPPWSERHLLCADGVVFHYGVNDGEYGLTLGYDTDVVVYCAAPAALEVD